MLTDSSPPPRLDRAGFDRLEPGLRVDLINLQYDLRDSRHAVLIELEGDDRAGRDGVVDRLQEWMDARYVRTRAFARPDKYIRERPVMWRYWHALPRRGRSALFLNAWLSQTVAARVRGEIDAGAFRTRLGHARAFERMLVQDGLVLVKLWLHISRDESAARLEAAKRGKRKALYVDDDDYLIYEHYDDVIAMAEEALALTHCDEAPWIVVESADARYRDVAVATAIRDAMAAARDATTPRAPTPAPAPAPSVAVAGRLNSVDLSGVVERKRYEKRLDKLQSRVRRLSRRARKRGTITVLAFEGWDAAGKGGVIRRVTRGVSARDYEVVPIGAPTGEELAHHYLWRFWEHIPRAGRMVIFDRSWYGRVLVERVEGFATEPEWRRAYAEINDFEAQLVEHGCAFAKFWLHISPEEQMRRFEARRQTAYKKYKITDEDERNRARWDDYARAVDEMVAHTDTRHAPWHLVAANDKPSARLEVLEAVRAAMDRK